MGIFQINRLAGLSYVQFWNINKTFESRGEGESGGKRARHGMMLFNVLLNRYKLFWPWPSLFAVSQRESTSGHAMGAERGPKRCAWLRVQGLKPHLLIYLFCFAVKKYNDSWKKKERHGMERYVETSQYWIARPNDLLKTCVSSFHDGRYFIIISHDDFIITQYLNSSWMDCFRGFLDVEVISL